MMTKARLCALLVLAVAACATPDAQHSVGVPYGGGGGDAAADVAPGGGDVAPGAMDAAGGGTDGGADGFVDVHAVDAPLADAPLVDAGNLQDTPDAAPVDAGPKPTWRVLFIGNSYTYYNNLPALLAALGDDPQAPAHFEVGMHASGGASWQSHDGDPTTAPEIAKGWDYVVLQDQSEQPWASVGTKPSLLSLDAQIAEAGAETILFMTWARSPSSVPATTSFRMNLNVNNYYERHGAVVGARVSPVGRAWERAIRTTGAKLYAADASHPTAVGSYLSACVIYATLTGVSPDGLGDAGVSMSTDQRAALQQVAWQTVTERQRMESPAVGFWPLAAAGETNDLIPSQGLALGDAVGPDGAAATATTFGLVELEAKVASIPYFPGINAAHFTVALSASRPDWSEPTAEAQTLVAKSYAYSLTQDGTDLVGSLTTTADPAAISWSVAALAPGWHDFALSYDGATFALWADSKQVAAAQADGDVRYYKSSPSEDARFNGIALGARFTDVFDAVDASAPGSAFTGTLAGVRLYDQALSSTGGPVP